jgi:tetratricopeptide (TPR) repeat protein
VISRYPNTKRFNEIVGEQYRIASAMLDGARGRMFFGLLPGFKSREKAIEYFETILANAPFSDYAPLSLMNIARGHQKLNQTEDAMDALDRMINNYPQSLLAPDAYLKLGAGPRQPRRRPLLRPGIHQGSHHLLHRFHAAFPQRCERRRGRKGTRWDEDHARREQNQDRRFLLL